MSATRYTFACSYPALLVVPATVTDESIRCFCRCYRQGRIPTTTWRHPRTKALLLRGAGHHGKSVMGMLKSHPTPNASTETTSSFEQEKYLSSLVSATPIFSLRHGSAWGMSDSSLSVNSLFLAADDPLGGATLTPEVARRSKPLKAMGTLA
jgi:myotubularin-related protein 5/13